MGKWLEIKAQVTPGATWPPVERALDFSRTPARRAALLSPSAETVACSGLSSVLSPGSTLGRCQACLTKDSPAQGHGASSPPPRSRPPPPLHPRPPRPQPRQTPVPASPPFWQVRTSRLGAPGDGSPPGMGWRALPGPLPGIA